ncbi:MAG: flagellar biosynthesis protein FlhB [Ruminococcaceae bacterium]|nr:flagellar biosynthesis protein FlhB [Oscillospiraceae bacterium]
MSKFDAKGKKNTGKTKAAALRYRVEDNMAPVVIASGYGNIADKIIGIAEEKGIPVFKDDSAASMLCMLEVGRDIPVELYEVIAAIYMQILKVSATVKHGATAGEIQAGLQNARSAPATGGTQAGLENSAPGDPASPGGGTGA